MEESSVPVDLIRWGLAVTPIVVLLVLLAGRRWKAPEAGPVGMALAAAIALVAFRTPVEALAVAAGKGAWDAVFILYVIWPALLLYRVIDGAGAFEALRRGVLRFSEDQVFLVLGFGWVFASFLQGVTGFGTPIAVVAPLLMALGVKPVQAVAIPLIGHAWANLFGTLGVAWLASLQVVDLTSETQTAIQTAAMLWAPNLLAGVAIAWIVGRGPAVRHALPLLAIISTIHGGGQLALAGWNPILANFLPAGAALLALYPLSHWTRYSEAPETLDELPAFREGEERTEAEAEPDAVVGLGLSVAPYVVLTVLAVAVTLIGPIESTFERVEVGLPFPAVETGFDVARDAEDAYSAFAPLTHPGTFLLVAAAVAWAAFRRDGAYERWRDRAEQPPGPLLPEVASDAIPASMAVVSFLVLSTVMDHAGQTEVLARGVAEVAPPAVYAFLAGWVGLLGSFMTSSNASSNILFSPLQQGLATSQGLAEPSILAAQHAGGAVGNSISPANVVLGTGAAGIVGREGEVLRTVVPSATASVATIGIATVILAT